MIPEPVSVVMPVRNEEPHLEAAVGRVLAQGYGGELEVVIAVGPSSDRTREIADSLAATDERVVVVDNPTGFTPAGLNLAIEAASYEIIVRVDGHAELCPGYITTAVETLRATGAANVGGLMDAQGRTPFEQAVAAAYNSHLGLGGGGFHLAATPAGPADTVFLGVFRRDALKEVGGFDESLHRAQDWELNYRLRRAGHLVWFTPELRVVYRPRSSLRALAKQFHLTGRWRREVVRRHPDTASRRRPGHGRRSGSRNDRGVAAAALAGRHARLPGAVPGFPRLRDPDHARRAGSGAAPVARGAGDHAPGLGNRVPQRASPTRVRRAFSSAAIRETRSGEVPVTTTVEPPPSTGETNNIRTLSQPGGGSVNRSR